MPYLFFDQALTTSSQTRHQAISTSRLTVQCASCGRTDGNCASGISVNTIGCTGACLHWAIIVISIGQSRPSSRRNWDVSDEDCTCIEMICSDVNPQRCAMSTHVLRDQDVNPQGSAGNDDWYLFETGFL